MWEEDAVDGKKSCVQAVDHHTLSHKSTVDHEDSTQVATVRSECIVHFATWTPITIYKLRICI